MPPLLLGTDLPALAPIPPGVYPLWRLDGGQRHLASHRLRPTVFLGRALCTVEEYARFLEAEPGRPLPDQPEAGWRSTADTVHYRASAADMPVAGISRDEAEAYCRWLSASVGQPGLDFRLPDPDWLRIAVWGPELRELPWQGVGPFGHRNLLGRRWQHTAEESVFGGSETLASDPAAIEKTLLRGWPDLCRGIAATSRGPDLGFRVCVVVYSERGR